MIRIAKGLELPDDVATQSLAIPRIRGGTDEPENLVSACSSCNNRKGDLTADEFTVRWL